MNLVPSHSCQLCSPALRPCAFLSTRTFSRTIFLLASFHHSVYCQDFSHFWIGQNQDGSKCKWSVVRSFRTFGLCYSSMTGNKRQHVRVVSLTSSLYVFLCLPGHESEERGRKKERRKRMRKQEKSERSGFGDEEEGERKGESSWELPFPPDRSLQ